MIIINIFLYSLTILLKCQGSFYGAVTSTEYKAPFRSAWNVSLAGLRCGRQTDAEKFHFQLKHACDYEEWHQHIFSDTPHDHEEAKAAPSFGIHSK